MAINGQMRPTPFGSKNATHFDVEIIFNRDLPMKPFETQIQWPNSIDICDICKSSPRAVFAQFAKQMRRSRWAKPNRA